MTQYDDYTRLQAITKYVYGGDRVQSLVPDNVKWVFEDFDFSPRMEAYGDRYIEAIAIATEQGMTMGGGTAGVLTLNTPQAMKTLQCIVDGFQMAFQVGLPFDMAVKAARANSPQSFEKAVDLVLRHALLGHRRALATVLLYGGSSTGIGVITGAPSGNVVTLTQASCPPGVYVGADGLKVDVWDPTFTTKRGGPTQVTTSNMSSVSAPTVTLDSVTGVQSGDIITVAGSMTAVNTATTLGLEAILTQTGGTLYSINQTTNPLFAGNQYAAGGVLQQSVIDSASMLAVIKGYTGKMTAYVHPAGFNALNNELYLRVKPADYAENTKPGYKSFGYFSTSGVYVDIVATPWVKRGSAYLIANEQIRRIGAYDMRLGPPVEGMPIWQRDVNATSVSTVTYSHQALFTSHPEYNVVITGIT